MKTAVIIQARMASTRLPGKVLRTLAGATVLAHVIERCRAIRGADVVCCAVSDDRDSDPVAREAERVGAAVFRGSEHDVLDRYWQAANWLGADLVMRVTSDCPLVDPEVCDAVLDLQRSTGADYACNNMPPSWPHGLDCEACTFAWLTRAHREAVRPSEREHVTPFIRNHPEARKVNLPGPGGDAVHHRWTIDHPADFTFLTEIFSRLPPGRGGWHWQVPFGIVSAEPELAMINRGFDRYEGLRKSLAEDARRMQTGVNHGLDS
ncbi:MAG TPA: glycosyltransferase family protein [Alphaproteobacteria bacterium]